MDESFKLIVLIKDNIFLFETVTVATTNYSFNAFHTLLDHCLLRGTLLHPTSLYLIIIRKLKSSIS